MKCPYCSTMLRETATAVVTATVNKQPPGVATRWLTCDDCQIDHSEEEWKRITRDTRALPTGDR